MRSVSNLSNRLGYRPWYWVEEAIRLEMLRGNYLVHIYYFLCNYFLRCWTYETSVLLNTEISNDLPYNDFFEYYAPDFKLHLTPSPTMENHNSIESLQVFGLKSYICACGLMIARI